MHVHLRLFLRAIPRFSIGIFSLAAFIGVPTLAGEATFTGPEAAGTIEAPPRREASGVAASRRSPGVWWVHDDSGGPPVLYAIDEGGKKIGSVRVTGVKSFDWEDVAAFSRDGKCWLLIADIGDNFGNRPNVQLHLMEEPSRETLSAKRETPVTPVWSLRVRYEDGPRDCEAIAVDPQEGAIYLLSKRDSVPKLYRVPLAASDSIATAQSVGQVPHVASFGPGDSFLKAVLGKRFEWPTAMDFAPDGSAAVILTYSDVLLFPRSKNEPWATALARAPERLGYHGLPQAEGVSFSADGAFIYVVSESSVQWVRYKRTPR